MIAIASDHGGYELKGVLTAHMKARGIEFTDYGTDSEESVDYPVYARRVTKAVKEGKAVFGVIVCGTGIGVSITANREKGIRAALCTNTFMAEKTREHNDANVLCMGGRVTDPGTAVEILDTFLGTPFSNGERHLRRIQMIDKPEEE